MVVKNRVLSHYGKRPIWETSLVRWDSDTGMRTPQSSVKSPSKRHIPSHSRKQAGLSLWHRGVASAGSGRQLCRAALPSSLPLLGCHPPGPQAHGSLPSSIPNTEQAHGSLPSAHSKHWASLKKKSMQCGLNASFFKNLIFQIQIIEAPLKKKIQLPHNQLLYVKKKALLQWLKTVLESVWQSVQLLTSKCLAHVLLPFVSPLPVCEWYVPVFNHVLYLPLHCDTEKHDEVHHQDRPEHGDVESLKEGTDHSHKNAFCSRMPKFEFWKPSNEGAKFLILFGW